MKYVIITLVVIIIIFIVAREFWCWYWKINERIKQANEINKQLEEIKNLLVNENVILSNSLSNGKDKDILPPL